ncbi:RodZ domain-containing protein [Deinococcus sp.]|uniref:RodZ domain-containing protein n=1 Tax=Deinococcus sp. TaxID=47478 RepID=UPI003CC6B8F8
MSFGNELKVAREGLGLSIQDVAQSTKIRSDYLKALEAEELSALPERPFARSYLQNVTRELRIESAPLLRDFDQKWPQPQAQTHRPEPRPARRGAAAPRRPGIPAGLVGGVLGGLLLLGLAGYVGYTAYQSRTARAAPPTSPAALPSTRQVRLNLVSTPSGARVYLDNRYLGLSPIPNFPLAARAKGQLRVEYGGRQTYRETLTLGTDRNLSVSLLPETAASRAAERLAAQQAAQPRTPVPAPVAAPPTTPVATPAPAHPSPQVTPSAPPPVTPPAPTAATPVGGIRLSFSGASWTRVTTRSGQVLYQGIPAAGSSQTFPSGVTVRTGSAGAVKVSVGGGPANPLGAPGQVVTRTF